VTTREDYAKLAEYFDCHSNIVHSTGNVHLAEGYDMVARILRQLAEGAVMCDAEWHGVPVYVPIEEQPTNRTRSGGPR